MVDRQLRRILYDADSRIHGRGVFALRGIAAGDYIGTFHGPEARRDGRHVLWVYEAENGTMIGRIGRNLLRYLNHATPCNAAFDGFDLYASVPIAADEEITIDYGVAP